MAVEKSVTTKFTTLYIDPIVMKRINYYTQAASGEVSGLGIVSVDEKGRHVVNKVYLLEQESSGADTELKPEAISKLMVDMMKENEDPGKLKFWWHSHANMGVFWSGTDDTCAETLSKEFAFSLVVNKAGDRRCRLDLYQPFRITFDGVKVEVLSQEDKALKEECEKEVQEKVKAPYEKYTNWRDKDYDGYGYGYGQSSWHDKTHVPSQRYGDIKSKVMLPDPVVGDINTLMDMITRYEDKGGARCPSAWADYIFDILKDTVERRLEKKAACKAVLTYDKTYEQCLKSCKVSAFCRKWTEFFEKNTEPYTDKIADITIE